MNNPTNTAPKSFPIMPIQICRFCPAASTAAGRASES